MKMRSPKLFGEFAPGRLRNLWHRCVRVLPFLDAQPKRELRLCENLRLGERRFLSVVEFGERRILVGGTSNSLALLATLPDSSKQSTEIPTWEFFNGDLVRCS